MPFAALRSLLRPFDRLRGKLHATRQVTLPMRRLGSDYGGYAIAEQLVQPSSVVYSFGIGEDLSFDLALIEQCGCRVHAFDPTPRVHTWLKAQTLPADLIVHNFGLSDYDGVASFTPPPNPAHVSLSVVRKPSAASSPVQLEVRTLPSVMKALQHSQLDVLKMDIEGAEYAVIDALAKTAIRPSQLLVEFHHQLPGTGVAKTERAIATLNALDYLIFDVQPSGHEFSFVHRSACA